MAWDINAVPHVAVQMNQEANTGVVNQNAPSTRSSVAYAASNDVIHGKPVVVVIKAMGAADVAYDAAGAIHLATLAAKPTLSEKYRILKVETVLRTLRTGGSPDHDLKVQMGDGAASESFTDVVASVDVDSDTVGLPTGRSVVNTAATVWSSGRTLRAQLSIAGSTTTGTTEFDFIITMVPTNEAIA